MTRATLRRTSGWWMLAVVVGLVGCQQPQPAEPVADPVTAAANHQVRLAREALGVPVVTLAEAVLRLRTDLDALRHEVPRGPGMAAASTVVEEAAAEVIGVAETARSAAADVHELPGGPPRIYQAADVVDAAATTASMAASAARAEVEALAEAAALDQALDEAVAVWGEPGSQSERRERLQALTNELDVLRTRAAAVTPVPGECPDLWDHRVRWVEVVADRTEQLAEQATAGSGSTYDELRDAFARSPLGEDRLAADVATRDCWLEHSFVEAAVEELRGAVEAVERLLA